MAFEELILVEELPETIKARTQLMFESALRLATRAEIDGQPIDDDDRARFAEYAGKLFLDAMTLEQQADYVGNHFGVKFDNPDKGVVAGNLPADPDDFDIEVRGSMYATRINPDASYNDLRALHMFVGEELVNSRRSN